MKRRELRQVGTVKPPHTLQLFTTLAAELEAAQVRRKCAGIAANTNIDNGGLQKGQMM